MGWDYRDIRREAVRQGWVVDAAEEGRDVHVAGRIDAGHVALDAVGRERDPSVRETAPQGRVRMGRLNRFRYSVDIETWGQAPSDDQVDAFIDALSSLGAPASTIGYGGLAGGIGATFSVDMRGVEGSDPVTEAARSAVEMFEAACEQVGIVHDGIARVDVMTDPYLERWITQEPVRYAGVSEVADLFGVSRQRVAQLRTKPGFPAPVAELRSGPVWDVSSLGLFLQEWERRPGRPRRAKSA